jgi:excisionase family DNA binding protein
VSTTDAEHLPLQQAADELGVHYQTAYRWVRSGQLPAQLVAGKYVVARDDLVAVDERRREPGSPTAPSSKRVARQAARVRTALLEGDEPTVRSIARRLTDEGSSAVELIQSLFIPALRDIGQAWHDGEITVLVEHRASAIAERILGELAPNPRGRRRGTAVVAAVAGERHSLPTTMAAIALREANWRVEHLGADMPVDELVRFCGEHDVDVAVISLTSAGSAKLANETAERIRADGTPAIVGGPGRSLDQLLDEVRDATSPGRSS